ncbi:MAG: YraN family protein [Eubacteriales bacterium]
MNKKNLGDKGESAACRYLENKGYKIVQQNYRTRYGEVDIIAMDKETLVFAEVKLRTGSQFGRGLEAITKHKIDKIHGAAMDYIQKNYEMEPDCRFDVVEISKGTRMEILHIENAF